MIIPYVEVLDKYTLRRSALVEPKESWFELSYYDVGEFEVLCNATQANLKALKKGDYIKLPNKRFVWVITAIRYRFTASGARLILAKGYEAKWLLKKRCILTPVELVGTITTAVYGLVKANLGSQASTERKIQGFTEDTNSLLIDISGTQAPRGNLLEFVDNLLRSYNCGSQVVLKNGQLTYTILNGAVRNNICFSQSFDNLLSSEYLTDDAEVATYALVVSAFEETRADADGVEQKYKTDYLKEVNPNENIEGVDRAEIIVESNLSTKYEDANGNELEASPTSSLYQGWQKQEGLNELTKRIAIEEVSGEIDLQNSKYEFDTDFFIGDIVKVRDEYFNYSFNPRILKYTIKQDANGYGEQADYGG